MNAAERREEEVFFSTANAMARQRHSLGHKNLAVAHQGERCTGEMEPFERYMHNLVMEVDSFCLSWTDFSWSQNLFSLLMADFFLASFTEQS